MIENGAEQNSLFSAILGISNHEKFDQKGLDVYQRNQQANASRALSISFPVVYQLLGEELFSMLSQQFLQCSIPETGDWAEWGRDFPDWLKNHDIIHDLPYISDCAKLDWLHHQCERAENPELLPDSFQDLASPDAALGHLICNSTATVVSFDFPVVDIWLAHNLPEGERAEWMAMAREKLADNQKQTALIWRRQWQVQVRSINDSEKQWLEYVETGEALESAINKLSADINSRKLEPFAFDQWLPGAIESHLTTGFVLGSDTDCTDYTELNS